MKRLKRHAILLVIAMISGNAMLQPAQAGKLPVGAVFKLVRGLVKGMVRARPTRLPSTARMGGPARPNLREPAGEPAAPGKARGQTSTGIWMARAPFLASRQSCNRRQTDNPACTR